MAKTYAVIRTNSYYGPSRDHKMIGSPTEDFVAAESVARNLNRGDVHLDHNQYAASIDVWEVVWEIGDIHDCDAALEGERAGGGCVVESGDGRIYICKPLGSDR